MLKLWCLNNLEYVDTRSWLLLALKHGGTVLTLDLFNKHVFYLETLSNVLITGVKSSCCIPKVKIHFLRTLYWLFGNILNTPEVLIKMRFQEFMKANSDPFREKASTLSDL